MRRTYHSLAETGLEKSSFVAKTYRQDMPCLITLAGLPAARLFGGIFLVTTEPAPITVLSPILTPLRIIAFVPIHTRLPIDTGAVFTYPS